MEEQQSLFESQKREWQRKVEVELAQPYGVFAMGVVA